MATASHFHRASLAQGSRSQLYLVKTLQVLTNIQPLSLVPFIFLSPGAAEIVRPAPPTILLTGDRSHRLSACTR